jgi:hypothetical protein
VAVFLAMGSAHTYQVDAAEPLLPRPWPAGHRPILGGCKGAQQNIPRSTIYVQAQQVRPPNMYPQLGCASISPIPTYVPRCFQASSASRRLTAHRPASLAPHTRSQSGRPNPVPRRTVPRPPNPWFHALLIASWLFPGPVDVGSRD